MITDSKEINNITNDDHLNRLLKEAFFIDIETTGLSRAYSDLISITALLYEEGSYKIHQIFCEFKPDEPLALKCLKNLIKTKKYVITYNGNSFDIPFLTFKQQKHGIDMDFDSFVKIDLYSWLRHSKNKIHTDNLKLKSAEEFFNIKRNDTISGEDVTVLYEAYRIEPRKEFSYLIMQHNYEDVFNLPALFNCIISLYDKILYYNGLIVKINYEDLCIKKNALICRFNIVTDTKTDYIHPDINFNLTIDSEAQKMEIKIPLGFFKDRRIKEFYFIDNTYYGLKTYTSIQGIKKSLVPIKFNDKIFTDNTVRIVKNILDSVFKSDK